MTVTVRAATAADVPVMAALLNAIIAQGGTTAYQVPVREEELAEDYVTGPGAIAAHVAVAGGAIIGFQVLSRNPELPAGWADIGTYVSAGARGTGAGAALFAATRAAAARAGVAAINATIRADNRLGLGYYGRMGFSDYAADPDWRLDDGRRVGRVSKRFGIAAG